MGNCSEGLTKGSGPPPRLPSVPPASSLSSSDSPGGQSARSYKSSNSQKGEPLPPLHNNSTALELAKRRGDEKQVWDHIYKAIEEHQEQEKDFVNERGGSKRALIHHAARWGNKDACVDLIERFGADPGLLSRRGKTAAQIASEEAEGETENELVALLWQYEENVDKELIRLFTLIQSNGSEDASWSQVYQFLQKTKVVNRHDERMTHVSKGRRNFAKFYFLHWAAYWDKPQACENLCVQFGAKPKVKALTGNTPRKVADENNCNDAADKLRDLEALYIPLPQPIPLEPQSPTPPPAPSPIWVRTTGKFNLKSGWASRSSGDYIFDTRTDKLTVRKELVGTFCYPPAGQKQLPEDKLITMTEFQEIRCVEVISSEIMLEIQKSSNEGAMFVLPSQLNGAEYTHHRSIVDEVSEYCYDNTGGPRGQLAAHPAMGQFILDNALNTQREGGIDATDMWLAEARKLLEKEVSNKDMPSNYNGYLSVQNCNPNYTADVLQALRKSIHHLRILCGDGVQACGLDPSKDRLSSATHRVSLVYASAVPVNIYLNRTSDTNCQAFQKEIARMVLVGQYYGAMKLAIKLSKSRNIQQARVYMLPLGGGVFRNPPQMICECVSAAVELLVKDGVDVVQDIRIILLCWSGNGEAGPYSRFLRDCKKLSNTNFL